MNQTRETHVMSAAIIFPKQKVDAGVPESLHAWNKEWPRNRLGLAKWLVDPGNPLVARVTVNRWWGQLLERGSYPRRRISVQANPHSSPAS